MSKPSTDQLGTNYERWTLSVVEEIEGKKVERYYDAERQIHVSDNSALKEVKWDGRMNGRGGETKTGNVYIEWEERREHNTGPMVPSGINKPCKSETYFIGDDLFAYDFDKEFLKNTIIANRKRIDTTYPQFRKVPAYINGVQTSTGYLIPTWVADKICIRKVYFRDSVMGEDGLVKGTAIIDRIVKTSVEEEIAVLPI